MTKKKKRRRRKKRSYKTGTYTSIKTGRECAYRSGWELAYMKHLDADPAVITWMYEPFPISYLSNKQTGKIRKYNPDFLVLRDDGMTVEEVKPQNKLGRRMVKKKLDAGRQWCHDRGIGFALVTEVELKKLHLI